MAYYNLAQIFVLPSLYEPFGTVVNEALLSGCYTLCSSIAGSACLIDEPQNGLVFDPSNESGLYHKLKKALMGAVGLEEIALKGNKMQIRYAERMDCLLKCLYLSIN